jgi:predicted  nucleic acid-binding Zn-ribbon protein
MEKQAVLETIRQLLIVQERDQQLAQHQREFDSLPARQKETQGRIAEARQAVEQARENLKIRQAAVKQWELEIEAGRQQIAKLREQQYQIKSNQEYRVLSGEIVQLQEKVRELEEKALESMEQAEQAQAEVEQKKARLSRDETQIQEQLENLKTRQANLEREIAAVRGDRQALAAAIAPAWLARYNYVLDHKKDKALVAIENNACSQCHMTLPPQVIHDTRRAEDIVACSFCGRILYWTG